jgi:hypothetical protein
MRSPRPRPASAGGVVVGAVLAWLVIAWIGGPVDAGAPTTPGRSAPSIERAEILAAGVSDRPAPRTDRARSGPLRVLPAVPGAGSSSTLPPALIGDGGFPASLLRVEPLPFGLARRGPPAAARR